MTRPRVQWARGLVACSGCARAVATRGRTGGRTRQIRGAARETPRAACVSRCSGILVRASPSSSGLGHRPFKATTRVRLPLGAPFARRRTVLLAKREERGRLSTCSYRKGNQIRPRGARAKVGVCSTRASGMRAGGTLPGGARPGGACRYQSRSLRSANDCADAASHSCPWHQPMNSGTSAMMGSASRTAMTASSKPQAGTSGRSGR